MSFPSQRRPLQTCSFPDSLLPKRDLWIQVFQVSGYTPGGGGSGKHKHLLMRDG